MTTNDYVVDCGEDGESVQIASFQVGELSFGINVSVVQEVLKFQQMTMIPLAPPAVKGLINLRGQITPKCEI